MCDLVFSNDPWGNNLSDLPTAPGALVPPCLIGKLSKIQLPNRDVGRHIMSASVVFAVAI